MFQLNDYAVYQYWVCKIIDITTLKNNALCFDRDTLFYVMKSLYEKEMFYIPVENETSVRAPLSKFEALQLIDTMPSIVALPSTSDETYRNAIHHYDCYSYVKILKSIYYKSKYVSSVGKKLSILDNKYLHLAENYLFDELSFALDIPKNTINDFIKSRLNIS